MMRLTTTAVFILLLWTGFGDAAEDKSGQSGLAENRQPECLAVDRFFAEEVWVKVGERTCLKCHNVDGDASDSSFLLQSTSRNRNALMLNQVAFQQMAKEQKDSKSRLLVKAGGGLDHGGGEVLKSDSTSYRIIERFVRWTVDPKVAIAESKQVLSDYDAPPFFADVQMMSPRRLLRRLTLSLSGRLPSNQELAAVEKDGLAAIDSILDGVMTEDAFYLRLKEAFNDIFLTRGYPGSGAEILSYDHFNKTRHWYQKYDLSHIKDEKERRQAGYKLANEYRESLKREPMELIEYIVRNDRPFTGIVTADYIMVSPYSSRGYGVFEEVKDKFKNVDNPFEYIPVRLKALVSRNGKVQESETGYYPHAGFLSMFQYLRRYPSTETNRNRLRARMYFQHFLGIDIMALAPRVTDAAAVSAKYENPVMEAPDCVVCHKTVDPHAGLFQDYFNEEGHYGPRKEGWFTDVFSPGVDGEKLPDEQRWRALQWLGERTAKDPRFATAMVEHVYYILMGRKVLTAPEDIDDPMFASKRRAYVKQRELVEDVALAFQEAGFNLKVVFKRLAVCDFYRADGLATVAKHPRRKAELDDIGLVHMLTPEQLERKIEAVFGERWNRLYRIGSRENRFMILYGGIDSKAVTERMTDPSGAMGSIQRILANDVACKNVALDFTREPSQRRLFPDIEPDVVPGDDPQSENKIRKAIVHLHDHILGKAHMIDDPEVDLTYELFTGIVEDAKETRISPQGSYFCERVNGRYVDDSQYAIRAWRGVVTYLLRQHDFLYE